MKTFGFGNRGSSETTHDAVVHFTIESPNRVLVERETGMKIWGAIGITTEKRAEKVNDFFEADRLYDELTDNEETTEWNWWD